MDFTLLAVISIFLAGLLLMLIVRGFAKKEKKKNFQLASLIFVLWEVFIILSYFVGNTVYSALSLFMLIYEPLSENQIFLYVYYAILVCVLIANTIVGFRTIRSRKLDQEIKEVVKSDSKGNRKTKS